MLQWSYCPPHNSRYCRCKSKAIAGFTITGSTSYPLASARGQITRFRGNRFWLRFWCRLRIRCWIRRRFWVGVGSGVGSGVGVGSGFTSGKDPEPESACGVSEDDPEPPPSQPANRVALKIAAKSDFLYLNFLFINNASDKTKLKDS